MLSRFIRVSCVWSLILLTMFSGLLVNVLQLFVTLIMRFFLPIKTRRLLCIKLANCYQDLYSFLVLRFLGIRFIFTGDRASKSDCSLLVSNHSGGLDFINGVLFTHIFGLKCGSLITFLKSSIIFAPSVGLTNQFQGSIFLRRNQEKDQNHISKSLDSVNSKDYPRPFQIGMYPEGTRITDSKRIKSHEFAKQRSLPVLNHVLLPRTKGFLHVVGQMRSNLDSIIDATVAYEGQPFYFKHILLQGRFETSAVHVHIEVIPVKYLPFDKAQLQNWLMNSYVEKDRRLLYFSEKQRFEGQQYEIQAKDTLKSYLIWSLIFSIFFSLYSYIILFVQWNLIAATIFIVYNNESGNFKSAERSNELNLSSNSIEDKK